MLVMLLPLARLFAVVVELKDGMFSGFGDPGVDIEYGVIGFVTGGNATLPLLNSGAADIFNGALLVEEGIVVFVLPAAWWYESRYDTEDLLEGSRELFAAAYSKVYEFFRLITGSCNPVVYCPFVAGTNGGNW